MPLVTGGDGVIRISGTCVPLETVIAAFRDGATPGEIAQQYQRSRRIGCSTKGTRTGVRPTAPR